MRRQWGRGEKKQTRSFSEDVSNQLGTLAPHFHLSSFQEKGLARWLPLGTESGLGERVVAGCVYVCVCGGVCELGEGFKGQCTRFFFFVAGLSS